MHMIRRRRRAQTVGMEMMRGRKMSSRRERQATKNIRITAEAMLSFRHRRGFILPLICQPHFITAAKWRAPAQPKLTFWNG